jgi:hypothetical protein
VSVSDEQPIRPDLDRMLSWWMDGDAQAEEPSAAAAFAAQQGGEIGSPLDDGARFGAAEQQLVHALLLQLGNREVAQRQTRISRVVQAIRQIQADAAAAETSIVEPIAKYRGRFRAWAGWAVAASLLFAVASWLYITGSNTAMAALDRVVQALDDPIDRTYEITIEPVDEGALRKPDAERSGHARDVVPPEDRRPGLNGAILYVHGRNQFVVRRSTPNGEPVVNGSNGHENWLIRPQRPVLVSSTPGAFRIPMPENLATVPLVDIGATLAGLRHAYQVVELPAEKLTNDDPTRWRHLQARKIDSATKGPKVVSIWFHPTTNLIGRIQFEQMHLQGRPEPRWMTIALVARQPLPANWFDHEAHHSPDLPIEHVAP